MPDSLAGVDWASHPGLPALRQAVSLQDGQHVGVAFSGGADSTALLLAAHHAWPGRVVALHVNHGLQAAAHNFERHADTVCRQWGIALRTAAVTVPCPPGASIEAQARDARYGALAGMAQVMGLSAVCVAHHQGDQAETLLIALSRGAGLPGLAAMPVHSQRHGVHFIRPWLNVPGPPLRQWLAAQRLAYLDDPTNDDVRYTRNRIRHRLMPVLHAVLPGFAQTCDRSARHAAQAQTLLDEVAVADLQQVGLPPDIERLQALSPARRVNVLRHWLKSVGARQASDAQMQQLQRQIVACTTRGHHIHLKVGRGFVRRSGLVIVFETDASENL